MGFIRKYGILIGAALMVALMGYVWHEGANLCAAKEVSGTAQVVEPIESHENEIALHPLDAAGLLNSLQHGKY